MPGLRPPDIPPFNAFPSTLPRPVSNTLCLICNFNVLQPTLPPLPPNFDPTGLAAAFKPGPAAPHLNPAFLQEMSQGNNVVGTMALFFNINHVFRLSYLLKLLLIFKYHLLLAVLKTDQVMKK